MPTKRSPRKGSMQYWPRRKAKKLVARIRSWTKNKDAKLSGFPAYKAGMTHIRLIDPSKKSLTTGTEIMFAATILECPPIKILGANFYKKDAYGLKISTQVLANKLDKELSKTISLPKNSKIKIDDLKSEDYFEIRAVVHTQPKLTNIKKKPDILELAIGGSVEEQYNYIKEHIGKEVKAEDVFSEGTQLDSHSVTKGHGFCGPVKRFGVELRSHKSEKTKRGPGSLGPWHGPKMWRTPHAGQTGKHLRKEYNKLLLKIGKNPEEVNPKGGLVRYGEVKGNYMLIKGSVGGAKKRLITLSLAKRPSKQIPSIAPKIIAISTHTQQ